MTLCWLYYRMGILGDFGMNSRFWPLVAVAALPLAGTTARADNNAINRALARLEPEERAHQACDLKGIDTVRKATALRKVDRVKSSTSIRATFKDNIVIAKGGAVRAKGRWYALAFTCAVTEDQMLATSFEFKLGEEIPQDKWEDLGLW